MKILHRICLNSKKEERSFVRIKQLGIKYKTIEMPGGKSYLVYFDIAESDPNWPRISQLVQTYKIFDGYDTYFTTSEVLQAEWVRLVSTYAEGYPQPFETWVTNPVNYDNNCRLCGTFQQKSSFRIKHDPGLRKNDFMTLNWAISTFFCTTKVLIAFESHQIKGFEIWNVLLKQHDLSSQKVFQLFVPNETTPGLLDGDDLAPEKCSHCDITRYTHHQLGIMRFNRIALNPELDIVRSFEWFGSGRDAYQEVLVSNRVARIILENGWKGVRFKVIELV